MRIPERHNPLLVILLPDDGGGHAPAGEGQVADVGPGVGAGHVDPHLGPVVGAVVPAQDVGALRVTVHHRGRLHDVDVESCPECWLENINISNNCVKISNSDLLDQLEPVSDIL